MENELLNLQPLQPSDIDFIIDRLWERGEEEALLYGLTDKNVLREHLVGMVNQYGYCLKIDGEPVAAFGAASGDSCRYSTWFIATERFNEKSIGITRFLRSFIREKIRERPDAELELVSAVRHPEAPRWFHALGFTRQGASNGVFSRYKYRNRAKAG